MMRVGTKFIAELPPGEWRLVDFKGEVVIAMCPDHPPRVIKKDGTMTTLTITVAQ